MLTDSQNFIAFRKETERLIQSLTERAMNPKTDTQTTHDLKLRVAQLKDLLTYARGESEHLS